MRLRLLSAVLLISSFLYPVAGSADQCSKLESEGLLLHQQFKKSKVCKESTINRGWTDCFFKAYGTTILLAGAIGTTVDQRMFGMMGSGFYVLSVDERAQVRVLLDHDFGSLLRIDGKDNLEESGCIYNEVYVTLDARVLGPGEFNQVKYGRVKLPETQEEKIRALQEGLAILGYNPGKVDGVLGPQTLAAMEKYKRDKGLSSTASVEDIRQLVSMGAALKLLDKMRDLYEESAAPKPTLRK